MKATWRSIPFSFLFVLSAQAQLPPTITCPADVVTECDQDSSSAATGVATATDGCDTPLAIVENDDVAPGACPQESTIERTWTATDPCGNTSSCMQMITIVDTTAPAITCPADVTIECDQDSSSAATGVATATDNCGTTTIDESDDVGPGACPQESTIERTWTATDSCGNASSCGQMIMLVDTTAPTFDNMPVSVEVDCSGAQGSAGPPPSGCPAALPTDIPPVPIVGAMDNCDPDPNVALVEQTLGNCPGVTVRTWTATDGCGNETEMIQLVVLREACVGTTTYWASQPEEWLTPFGPVTEFELGCAGDTTSAADALVLLNGSVGSSSDASVTLARELIAAILNVAQGADDSCAAVAIQEARDFLCVVPIGSNPGGALETTANGLRLALEDYNLGNCCAPSCLQVAGAAPAVSRAGLLALFGALLTIAVFKLSRRGQPSMEN